MAAYKQFNSQDIIVSPLEVTKAFTFSGSQLTTSDINIARYAGNKFNTTGSAPGARFSGSYSGSSIYFSAKQLYYSNYLSGSNGEVQNANTASFQPDGTILGNIPSNAYFNYNTTDLNPQKYFPTSSYETTIGLAEYGNTASRYGEAIYGKSIQDPNISVMSIPKSLFGDYIQPKSLNITTDSGSYFDNGEGVLMRTSPNVTSSIVVGNIIYEHGIIVFTGGTRKEATGEQGDVYGTAEYGDPGSVYGGRTIGNNDVFNFAETTNITCSFSSSFTIYETQYKCTIQQDEFNYSQNPSTITGSSNDGDLLNFVTSSYFSPYVTTVGMYNRNNQLVAVGKLAQPLPTSRTTDTTILVNIDRQ
tara:strand:- start:1207 stop:2286 length:1080 start_codon:yes stop_codon:yes gene_type:complete